MNEGLTQCRLFLLFVSKHSLQSNMVKLEWQNALLKANRGEAKIVPVKLDDCLMPLILMQSLYIDLFGQGLEVALRQILDVARGQNTFLPGPQAFSNARAYARRSGSVTTVECKAEHYMEPISRFVFIVDNDENDLKFKCLSSSMCEQGFNRDIELDNGRRVNGQLMGVERATVPGFPFVVEIAESSIVQLKLTDVLHEKKRNQWSGIPLTMHD